MNLIVSARRLLTLTLIVAVAPAAALPVWRPSMGPASDPMLHNVEVICSKTKTKTLFCADGHVCQADGGDPNGFKCPLGPELLRQWQAQETQRREKEMAERQRHMQAERERQVQFERERQTQAERGRQQAATVQDQLRERMTANLRSIAVGGVMRSCANPSPTWGAAEYYACHPQTARRESASPAMRPSGGGTSGGGTQTTTTYYYATPIQARDVTQAAADACGSDRSADCQQNAKTNILLDRVPGLREACANVRSVMDCADVGYARRSEGANLRERLLKKMALARPQQPQPRQRAEDFVASPSVETVAPGPADVANTGVAQPKDDVFCLFIAHRIRSGDLGYSRDEQVPAECRRDGDVLAALEATRRTRPGFPIAGEDTDREIARLTAAAKEPETVRREIGRAWGEKFEDELPPGLR